MLKQSFRKNLNKDKMAELSVITDMHGICKGNFKGKRKMVQNKIKENIKLLQEFQSARENAKLLQMNRAPLGLKPTDKPTLTQTYSQIQAGDMAFSAAAATPDQYSPYFMNQPSFDFSALQQASSNGEFENLSLEPISTSQPKRVSITSLSNLACHRGRQGIITPVTGRKRSETEYWTSFSSSGRRNRSINGSTNVGGNKSVSGWQVSSGMVMNREVAYAVQNEFESLTSSLTSENTRDTNNNRIFDPFQSPKVNASSNSTTQQGMQQFFEDRRNMTPMRSMLQEIIPPSSLTTPYQPQSMTPNSVGSVVVGEWINRNNNLKTVATKKYSIVQLLDILTGAAVPPTSELAGHFFNPLPSGSVTRDDNENPVPQITAFEDVIQGDATKRHKKKKDRRLKKDGRPLQDINNIWNNFMEEENLLQKQDFYIPPCHTESNHFQISDVNPVNFEPPIASPPRQRKSVSFLTDDDNNIAPNVVWLDSISQELDKLTGSSQPSTSNASGFSNLDQFYQNVSQTSNLDQASNFCDVFGGGGNIRLETDQATFSFPHEN